MSGALSKKLFTQPIVVICSTVLLFLMSQLMGVILAGFVTPYVHNTTYKLAIVIACNLLVLAGLVWLAMGVFKFRLQALGWSKPRRRGLLLVIPAFVIYLLASSIFTLLAIKFIPGFKSDQIQDVGFNNLKQPIELVVGFVSLAILTPIFEETIFRGVLFKGLRINLPFWLSAVLTSLIFAIAHMQFNVAIDVFALSLLLCYLTEKSDSIIPGILLHGLKNGLAFVLLFIFK